MRSRLTVDVVGCGEIAQIMHLPFLLERSDVCTVRAVCERDPHVLKGVAERFGVAAAFTDHREMLESAPADVLVVLTSGDHAPIIHDALDAGMDVFVEKPLCYSTRDAREIARRAKELGRTVMVGYSRLFDTAFDALREAVEAEPGPVCLRAEAALPMDYYYRAHLDVVRPLGWTPPEAAPEWGGSWDYLREEVLFNLAIHEVYCLRVLTGVDRPEILTASDVLDRRGVEVSWRSGDDLHVSMSVLTLDTIAGGYVEEFRAVTGSRTHVLEYPSIYLKHVPARLTTTGLRGGALVTESALGSYTSPFRAELDHFFDVVLDGRPCLSPAEDAAHDVETLNRVWAAAKDRRADPR
ncbi:Gfo/Idh/MocA family protein [Actinomadura sp. WMMA1423]|uniref:Gfo/Idh/MocA family protein n=1 Tax=Actinomadura sp. WMMA1423 TaxID=2591108 RepID=UPI00114747E0|nr:Gfo/Idh/MocA family oxidoreductase [Actinomadura sp. WMMA1423]